MRQFILAGLLGLAWSGPAAAAPVSYNFWLEAPNGYPVTHLVMYASDGTQDSVHLSPVVLPPSGVFSLAQPLDFIPTRAIVVGITERDRDDSWDIVMFTDPGYAAAAVGRRYNELFPSPSNLRHGQVPVLFQDAHAGDQAALAAVTNFLRGPGASAAYFDPHGPYAIIQFSTVLPPIGGPIPEPNTLMLFGVAGLALAGYRRANKSRPAV